LATAHEEGGREAPLFCSRPERDLLDALRLVGDAIGRHQSGRMAPAGDDDRRQRDPRRSSRRLRRDPTSSLPIAAVPPARIENTRAMERMWSVMVGSLENVAPAVR